MNCLIFPLYYNAKSVDRLSSYINENPSREKIEVFVYCTNSNIADESRKRAEKLGFIFIDRENSGGGEGAFYSFMKICRAENRTFSNVIYFEETCEPISKFWYEHLINKMNSGYSVYGWDWIWRGRKRISSKTLGHGSGLRRCFSYQSPDSIHPLGLNIENAIWDVPHFRNECLIIEFDYLMNFSIADPSGSPWVTLDRKKYGLSMERFYWENTKMDPRFNALNFQFNSMLKTSKWPLFLNLDRWRFRELDFRSGSCDYYVPKKVIFRRLNLKHHLSHAIYLLRNISKYIVISVLGFQPNSKLHSNL